MKNETTLNDIHRRMENANEKVVTGNNEMQLALKDYVSELLGGNSGFIAFDDYTDLFFPQFIDDCNLEDSLDIYGVKITHKKGVPILEICTTDIDFNDNENWFNPYIYGNFDVYELYNFIKENENNLIIYSTIKK